MSHSESPQQKGRKSVLDWLQTFALPIILALFVRFGPTILPEWVSDFLGIAIIITLLAGAIDAIYPHLKGWRRNHGGVDVEKLIVKRAFYAPMSRDKVIPTIEKLLEPKSFKRGLSDPTNLAGDFYKSPVLYMQQLAPEKWQKLVRERAPTQTNKELDDLVTETNKRVQFRSSTPTEVKVRVMSEFQGESFCEAECYPYLYHEIRKGEFIEKNKTKSEQIVKIAQNDCRLLLEELIAHLGGRVGTVPPNSKNP